MATKPVEKICVWCGKECLSKSTTKKVWTSWYHTYCLPKYNKVLKDIEGLIEEESGGPRPPQCRAGHVRTEENTKMYMHSRTGKPYPQCLDCRKAKARKVKAARYA